MDKVTLIYNEQLLKKAVMSFWWRLVGPVYIFALAVMLILFFHRIYTADHSWVTGVVGATTAMAVLFPSILYISHYRNTLGKFHELKGSNSTFSVDSEGFEIESIIGFSKMKWTNVTEVWLYQEYWLVFLSKSQFFTLPTSCLNNTIKESILNNIKAAGGKVA